MLSTQRKSKIAALLFVIVIGAACNRSDQLVELGDLSAGGKSDVLDLELTVPDLAPKAHYKIAFKSAVAFKIVLLTPKRAYARLSVTSNGETVETKTLDEPTLELPAAGTPTRYVVTVENRSTKSAYDIIGATLRISSLEVTPTSEITVPSERRSLAQYQCPQSGDSVPVVFFDADSTLRVSKSGSASANSDTDVYLLPFVAQKIASLNQAGYLVAIVSNQGGVSKGYVSFETAQSALLFTASQLATLGARIDYIDFAEDYDEFRKPEIGMANNLSAALTEKCKLSIDWSKSYMVGDAGYKQGVDGPHPDGRPADDFSNSDRGLAENLQIPFHEPTDYFGWRAFEVYNIHAPAELISFIETIEARAAALGGDPQADALKQEAAALRKVNGL